MTAQETAPEGGLPEGRSDQAGTRSVLPILSHTTLVDAGDTATHCRVCGRGLRAERSRRRRLGPVCAHRIAQAVTTATGHRAHVLVIAGDLVVRLDGGAR